MGWWESARGLGQALGIVQRVPRPLACALGQGIYRETKRAAQLANLGRPLQRMRPETEALMAHLFPRLDVARIRYRVRCRLPPNRFRTDGDILAMTFGWTIYWRGDLDESSPRDVVNLIHEVVHVDQVRRHGGERGFACAYGTGYVEGGGRLPGYITAPTAYHRNPLEAEAYAFEARFQDARGRAVASLIPWPRRTERRDADGQSESSTPTSSLTGR